MTSRNICFIILILLSIHVKAQVCLKHFNTSTIGDKEVSASSPSKIVSADFNNDGKADLAVIYNESINHATILFGSGTGGFGSEIILSTNNPICDISTSDFNNDKKTDIVIVSINNINYELTVFLGNGNGTFGTAKTTEFIPASNSLLFYSIKSADFNDDGNVDIATASMSDGISIHFGNGTGVFGDPKKVYSAGVYAKLVVVDVNNDKVLDIATTSMTSDSLFVFLGKGSGNFNAPNLIKMPFLHSSVSFADFDANGIVDMAVVDYNNTTIFEGQGDGTFKYKDVIINTSGDNHAIRSADYNSDGKTDIAICSRAYGLVLLFGNGDCTFKSPQFWDSDASSLVIADFDNDKHFDFAIIHDLFHNALTENIWVYVKAIPPSLDLGINDSICSKNPKLLDAGFGYSYQWSDGSKLQTLLVKKTGTYTVTITDKNSCSNVDSVSVHIKQAHAELNALATVFDNNRVVFGWERTSGQNTEGYKVLRETDATGVFKEIGSKLFNEDSYIVDSNVKVLQQTYRYKLRTYNNCGDSAESPIHKTMLVQVGYNKATGLNSLSWNGYEGIPLSTYRVFKNKLEITSLAASASNNMYAINDQGSEGDDYYISYDLPDSIYTTKVKADSGPFSVSLSNMAESELVGNNVVSWDDNIQISPNPARTDLIISSQGITDTYYFGQILNSIGQIIRKFEISNETTQIIDVSEFSSGLYQVQLITPNVVLTKTVVIRK